MLPLLLTGCFHHRHQVQNQQLAPPLPPQPAISTSSVDLPASATTIPPMPTETAKASAKEPHRPRRRRKPVDKNPQEAANVMPDVPPTVSAIGQLSSGDPADYRNQTADSINTLERGLNGLNRELSTPEQKTAEHIREFLKEARAALASGDVDGAHTLAAKAKVLLAELTK